MVTKTLDEIVMEDEVKERIRPLFEQATAAGDISFEHDWQWQAYCDFLKLKKIRQKSHKFNRYAIGRPLGMG